MMRAVLLVLAVSLVFASATTLRLVEISRVTGANWVFTTANPNYSTGDAFWVTKKTVVHRATDGTTSVIANATTLGLPVNATILRAAIHPTRNDIVIAWRRPTTSAEQQTYRVQVSSKLAGTPTIYSTLAANSTTGATFIIQVTVYNISTTTQSANATTGINVTSWPNWADTYDIGELRFIDNLLHIGTGNSIPADDVHGVYDYYQAGRQPSSLQGKLLRLDLDRPVRTNVNGQDEGTPFTADGNPFIHSATPSTVYSTGFVWLSSVIRVGTQLWGSDIQSGYSDELNAIIPGADFGWNVVEGTHCFYPNVACDFSNKVAPAISIDVPAGAVVDNYGITGIVSVGNGNFLASWNGTTDGNGNAGQPLIRVLNTTAGTYQAASIVDYRGVPFVWYYNTIQLIRMTAESENAPIFVLGQYWANSSSVLFQLEEVDTSASGAMSIFVAVTVAIIAALFH